MRALLIEDDARLQSILRTGLAEDGFAVDVASDGRDGLTLASMAEYDAIVLDLMLPQIPGAEVLRRLRRAGSATPVLILSARDSTRDRIEGLDGGADDYLVKPFAIGELAARLRALIRRANGVVSATVEIGDLVVDLAARRVMRAGQAIELRAKEFAILELLVLRRGRIVSREQIQDHVWGQDNDTLSNVVEVHVCRLRNQLEGSGRPLIETRRGQGYLIEAATR
ncbi:MAG: response regulator transcription factor [Planctomycetota bacterium]